MDSPRRVGGVVLPTDPGDGAYGARRAGQVLGRRSDGVHVDRDGPPRPRVAAHAGVHRHAVLRVAELLEQALRAVSRPVARAPHGLDPLPAALAARAAGRVVRRRRRCHVRCLDIYIYT